MAHWRQVLPKDTFHEVDHETPVAAQAAESRRLVDFCRLGWDDGHLRFHENRRPVNTASPWQMRQPITGAHCGRWKDYERFLAPLVAALRAS
jgi:hypothetical protein